MHDCASLAKSSEVPFAPIERRYWRHKPRLAMNEKCRPPAQRQLPDRVKSTEIRCPRSTAVFSDRVSPPRLEGKARGARFAAPDRIWLSDARLCASRPDAFVVLHTVGVPLPHLLAWLTTAVSLVGGLAVLMGAFIPIASVLMAVVLFTAMFTIHLPYGFFSQS